MLTLGRTNLRNATMRSLSRRVIRTAILGSYIRGGRSSVNGGRCSVFLANYRFLKLSQAVQQLHIWWGQITLPAVAFLGCSGRGRGGSVLDHSWRVLSHPFIARRIVRKPVRVVDCAGQKRSFPAWVGLVVGQLLTWQPPRRSSRERSVVGLNRS